MRRASIVSAVTIAAFLATGPLHLASAQSAAAPASPLRASIAREAARAAQLPAAPRHRQPVRKSMTQGGGGGGMMMITLISTVAGLAATYFVVKELQKQKDEITVPQ